MNNYNIFIDDFQANDIEIAKTEKTQINGKDYIVLYATQKIKEPVICPSCGSTNIYKKGTYTRKIKYLEAFGFPSLIILKQNRFVCRDCKKTFNITNTVAGKNSTISNNVKRKILFELQKKQSITDIANNMNISITSVLNTFDDNIAVARKPLSEVICIDEFKADTDKGKMACIIGNPITGEILDILPNCDLAYLLYYFNQISADECFKVKYCVFDLHDGYRRACKTHFKNATLIADRFHWIKLCVNAFNNIRIEIMHQYEKLARETKDPIFYKEITTQYEILKSGWKIFLANKHKIKESYFVSSYHKMINKEQKTIQEVLELALNYKDRLNDAYNALQNLYKLSVYSTYETFNDDMNEWIKKTKELNEKQFNKCIESYIAWKNEIRASFIINEFTGKRLTNGFIEGKNNYNKVIKRIAFGYQSFDKLRNRIMYVNSYILNLTKKK